MQEVVDATLSKKVETSIISNKSLQVLRVSTEHDGVLEAVLKGARGNTSLKELSVLLLMSCDKPDHNWSLMLFRNDSVRHKT